MSRGILILCLGFGAALAAFALARHQCGCACLPGTCPRDGASLLPELAWLRRELNLDAGQFDKVRELHLAHQPVCEALCQRIESSRQRVLNSVIQGDTESPAFSAALAELAAVETECRQALYRHVRRTAAELSPGQARSYYRLVLPRLPEESGTAGHQPGSHP